MPDKLMIDRLSINNMNQWFLCLGGIPAQDGKSKPQPRSASRPNRCCQFLMVLNLAQNEYLDFLSSRFMALFLLGADLFFFQCGHHGSDFGSLLGIDVIPTGHPVSYQIEFVVFPNNLSIFIELKDLRTVGPGVAITDQELAIG
jgi:hypothetical protein